MAHIQPRKRFGQHFLQDESVIEKILQALQLNADDHVVEIGPGTGVLTRALLSQLHHLDAVEIDRDLVPILLKNYNVNQQLCVYQGDALDFDFCKLVDVGSKLRLVGNLPYNITTPLLFHVLSQADCIQDMHFMIQKEVAERMQAGPGTHAYGRLSVMVQYHCEVHMLFTVPPESFDPPPQVQSAVIRLVPYLKLPVVAKNYAVFAKVVATAFNQRRKTLRNSLKSLLSSTTMLALNIDPQKRAENLSLQDYVHLANEIS